MIQTGASDSFIVLLASTDQRLIATKEAAKSERKLIWMLIQINSSNKASLTEMGYCLVEAFQNNSLSDGLNSTIKIICDLQSHL